MKMTSVSEAIEKRLVEIINPPKDTLKKPSNRLWIAVAGANIVFFVLDLITAATVGYLVAWYYGAVVFLAGFVTLLMHEALFANPYASNWQRVISLVGFGFSLFSTLVVGLFAVAVNVMQLTAQEAAWTEIAMVGGLFVIALGHGVLLSIYIFIDAGIRAAQAAMASLARHEDTMRNFKMSEQVVDKTKEMAEKLQTRVDQGDGVLIDAAFQNIAGKRLVEDPTRADNSSKRLN